MSIPQYKTQLHPAFIVRSVRAEEIERLARAGAEGVEVTGTRTLPIETAREYRRIVETNGLKIHSVMCGGARFDNPESVDADVEGVKRSLRVAAELGASAALFVPGRIDAPALAPWAFDVEFDPKTLHVSRICSDDNSQYAEYIKRQNETTDATRRAVERILPAAAYEGVVLALENVWNNLWPSPALYAALVKSFENVWLKAYFDLGNGVKYAKTENWLAALGKGTVRKLHIKDFKVDKTRPNGGDFVPLGKGSVDWISVRAAIEAIEYDGFVTLENEIANDGYSPEARVQVLRDIFAGRPISVEPEFD